MKMCGHEQYDVIASNDQINETPTQMSWQYAPQQRRKESKENNDSPMKVLPLSSLTGNIKLKHK